ncbi:MAG: hypothetical protein ACE5O2_05600, partial [Armatimonadota bacterium]
MPAAAYTSPMPTAGKSASPDDDRLEITLEDLADVEEPPPPAPPPAAERLVVEVDADDVSSAAVEARPPTPSPLTESPPTEAAPRQYPGLVGQPAAFAEDKEAAPGRLLTANLAYAAIFGLLGGGLAWALTEPTVSRFPAAGALLKQVVHEAAFFGIVGAAIGFAVGATEGAVLKLFERAMGGGALYLTCPQVIKVN